MLNLVKFAWVDNSAVSLASLHSCPSLPFSYAYLVSSFTHIIP